MIHIVANTKGGVGKSLTSITLACVLISKGKKIKIIEIDNNQNSMKYINSDVLNSENIQSISTDKKDTAIADILFDVMSDPGIHYIVDAGGGDDTYQVLEALKDIGLKKTFYIPTLRIKKYLQNAFDTYNYINQPDNTIFVLNQYQNLQKIKDEFIYFFGNSKKGIKPVSPIFKDSKFIAIPWTDSFQIAEDDEMTIYDFSSIARDMSEKKARELFFKQAEGSRDKFEKSMIQYWNAIDANKDFLEIIENFWNLGEN